MLYTDLLDHRCWINFEIEVGSKNVFLTLQGTGYFEDTDRGGGGIMPPSIISPKRVFLTWHVIWCEKDPFFTLLAENHPVGGNFPVNRGLSLKGV